MGCPRGQVNCRSRTFSCLRGRWTILCFCQFTSLGLSLHGRVLQAWARWLLCSFSFFRVVRARTAHFICNCKRNGKPGQKKNPTSCSQGHTDALDPNMQTCGDFWRTRKTTLKVHCCSIGRSIVSCSFLQLHAAASSVHFHELVFASARGACTHNQQRRRPQWRQAPTFSFPSAHATWETQRARHHKRGNNLWEQIVVKICSVSLHAQSEKYKMYCDWQTNRAEITPGT